MQRTLYTLPARALQLRSRCTQQRALSGSLPPHRLMPMPRLSPSMSTGRLDQWLVAVGDEVVSEHVVCEVSTSELTEDPDDETTLVLQIESHEDGFLAKILLPDGASAAPDVPIAVICENADDVAAFDDFQAPALVEPATFAWQGFLKDPAAVRECGDRKSTRLNSSH